MTHHHTYTCLCGERWDEWGHIRSMTQQIGVKPWRGNPGQMVPHRQWIRENMPATHEGFVCAGDDGFLRTWTHDDQLGFATPVEWKTYGSTLDNPTRRIFEIVYEQPDRIRKPLTIRLVGGNVPSALAHYPYTAECDLPEQPVVATEVWVNDVQVDPANLVVGLLRHTAGLRRAA